jgi:hypothetical protein
MLDVKRQATASRRKQFFFEKKNQKPFANGTSLYPERPKPKGSKVFCFFSSKKQSFPSLPSDS